MPASSIDRLLLVRQSMDGAMLQMQRDDRQVLYATVALGN